MSFSARIKTELCEISVLPECCQKAQCYGALLFARSFSDKGITLLTENASFARLVAEQIAQECDVFVDMEKKLTHRTGSSENYMIHVPGDDQVRRVLRHFGHDRNMLQLSMQKQNMQKNCCRASFLRGVFLSCGSITNPEKEYHLEFTTPHQKLAKELAGYLADIEQLEMQPAITTRKGSSVVYLKNSESIVDFLTFLGASNGVLELIQVKMLKEVRNDVNRRSNCETANLMKTANAAAQQRIAIEKISRHMGLDELSPELKELALLRYRNPEMSLRELGENLSVPISRSGVNHRIRRLMEIAENLPD